MSEGNFLASSKEDQYSFLVPIAPDSYAVRFIVSSGYKRSDSRVPVSTEAPNRYWNVSKV